jgi:DNA polymerase delta subunit 1
MSQTGVRPSSWVRVAGLAVDGLSHDKVQLEVSLKTDGHFLLPVDKDELPPMSVHSFDIEVICPNGGFPNYENPGDAIVAIAASTLHTKDDSIQQVVHGLCQYTPIPGVTCFMYETEAALLEGWAQQVIRDNPDILTGYNINRFDWEYMMKRAMRCLPSDSIFYFLGKPCCVPGEFKSVSSTTKAFGTKEMFYYDIPGRTNFDLLQFLRTSMPTEEDYSLGAIATKVLGDTKMDLSIKLMNQYFQSGDPNLQSQVMEYCVKDTLLPLQIILKRLTIVLEIEMSRVCCVFLSDLWARGQMFKVMSQFFLHARECGYVVSATNINLDDDDEGYTGALVLAAKVGVYQTAATFDFASLYPSIMIANNLCSTSLVPGGRPAEPDGIEYLDVQVDDDGRTFTFQQSVPGLLPDLLRKLLEARKRAKKDMNATSDPEKKKIYHGRQLALKVSSNSVYGTQGAKNSMVGCKAVAETTTKLGRQGLGRIVDAIEKGQLLGPFGEELTVIYGDTDSVFVAFEMEANFEACKPRVFEWGPQIAKELNKMFKKPVSIEFEKAWTRFVIMKKKCYIGIKHVAVGEEGYMDATGYAIVKRDYCAWQRETMQVVIERFLMQDDLKGSLEQLSHMLDKLMTVQPRDLMLTKRLGADYKNENLLQCVVAREANEREPGQGPKPGDRVQYLVIEGPPPLYTKVQDFNFAVREKLPIDYDYYAEHLINPLTSFFDCFGPQVMARVLSLFRDAAGKRYRLLNRVKDLSEYISSTAPPVQTPLVMPRDVEPVNKRRQASLFGGEAIQEPVKKKPRRAQRKVGKQGTLEMSLVKKT